MKLFNSQRSIAYSLLGLSVALLSILGLNSCDSIVGTNNADGTAKLNVFLTDAPAEYDAVYVDIQKIRVHHESAEPDSAEGEGEGNEGKWITLSKPDMKVDLLKLQNGADTLLASSNLEPGHYTNLRLILGSDNEVVVNGNTEQLKVPSGQQSGYKLKINSDIKSDTEYKLVIDFDAKASVHKAGKSGKYILRPVLRTVSLKALGSEPEAGSISGVIQPAESESNVFTVINSDTISTTADTVSGEFELTGLKPDSYNINIDPTTDAYMDTVISNVSVEAGEETRIDTVLLQSSQ